MQNKNRGAAMVEFAIVVPFFFMLMLSIIYGALVMHDINSLNEITRNALRYGSVIDSGVSFDDKKTAMVNFVKAKANDSLFLYTVTNGTQVEVVNSEITLGNTGSDSSATQDKALKLTVTADMKEGLPTMFLSTLPKNADGKVQLSTISSELVMRRED